MKKVTWLMLLVAVVLSSTSCLDRVEAGFVGVKVNLLGDNKGVQAEPLGVGRYWIGMNEQLFIFPVSQVNYVYTQSQTEGSEENEEFTFQTKEGMNCEADLGVALSFSSEKVSTMFQKYRKGVDDIRSIVVRNEIRDALNRVSSTMSVEDIYGVGKAKLIDSIQSIVKKNLEVNGILIDKISLIGSIRIPDNIRASLNAKVQMTQDAQRAENQVQKAIAEANIRTAKAKGEADAKRIEADAEAYYNRTVSSSLTPSLVEIKRIDKWDGVNSTTILSGSSQPIVNMK